MSTQLNPKINEPLNFFYSCLLMNKELTVKRTCYQCGGKGFYTYYDPILDNQGYYDRDDTEMEREQCCTCKDGEIILKFKSQEQLKTWIEKKLKQQDWSYTYSDDPNVQRRENFYQSLTQELLWILPTEIAANLLNQYQNNIDPHFITINLYQQNIPLNYKYCSNYICK